MRVSSHRRDISVTPCLSVLGPLMAARNDQAFHIGLHQQLKTRFRNGAQKIALIMLWRDLNNIYISLGPHVVRG